MWATIGILAALHEKQRTGRGQWVDISLLDGSVSWLTYVSSGYFASGETPRRYGSAHPTIAPYQAFATADGFVMVAVGNDGLWRRFAAAVDREDLLADERFAKNPSRVAHRDVLIPLIEQVMLTRTTEEWVQALDEAGVPVGPIQTVDQAVRDPQVLARGMVAELQHPTAGPLKVIGCPIRLTRTPASVRTAPPSAGPAHGRGPLRPGVHGGQDRFAARFRGHPMTVDSRADMDTVSVELAGSVATIHFGSGQRFNALGMADWLALEQAAQSLAGSETLRAVVLRGRGGAFCSGSNLREWDGATGAEVEPQL